MDSFGNALNIFISTVLRSLKLRPRYSIALTFANVSTVTELTLQCDISSPDKEGQLMTLRSVGIWRPRLLYEYTCFKFGNNKNVSGWSYCSLLYAKYIYIYIYLFIYLFIYLYLYIQVFNLKVNR